MLRQKKVFPFPETCKESILLIKQAIAASVLVVPDLNRLLQLETDASGTSIATTLSQEGQLIAFFSLLLTPREKVWSAVELEVYAVVTACAKLGHFLLAHKFEIVVDQQGVSFLFNEKPKSAIKNAKLGHWRLQVLEYRFTIVYSPGRLIRVSNAHTHCSAMSAPTANFETIKKLHESMSDPGAIRLHKCHHFTKFPEMMYCI